MNNHANHKTRLFLIHVCLMPVLALLAAGCASTRLASSPPAPHRLQEPRTHLPSDPDSIAMAPMQGSLPFGIGAQVQYFLEDTGNRVGGFYSNVVKPMQQGQVFAKTRYALDYAVRDRGDTFDNPVGMDRISFRSHYDIRVGINRRFHRFDDLLRPGFWLGDREFLNHAEEPASGPRPITQVDASIFKSGPASEPLAGMYRLPSPQR